MDETRSQRPHSKPSYQRFLLITVIAFVPLFVLLLRYRSHLVWKIVEYRMDLHGVHESPTQIMAPTAIPRQWRNRKFGGLQLALPSDMTEQPVEDLGAVFFENEVLRVLVYPRSKLANSDQEFLEKAAEYSPTDSEFTTPRLRFEIYQKDVDDFRWSMTNQEVLWHFYCVNIRCDKPGQEVEGTFTDNFDGILVTKNDAAYFDWQTKTPAWEGSVQFAAQKGKLNLEVVRAICSSVAIDEGE